MSNTATVTHTYERAVVMVGVAGTAVHYGVKEDGKLLPFPTCGAHAHRVAVETDADVTCPKCIARDAKHPGQVW